MTNTNADAAGVPAPTPAAAAAAKQPTTLIPTPSHATVSITINNDDKGNMSTLEITALGTIIDDSMTKPGVWGLYDENGVLLDVAQTVNITSEWNALTDKLGRPKFISMQDNGVDLTKLIGKVITFENDKKTRLLIEQAFAEKYGALYWHPQPGTFQCPEINDPNAIGIDYTSIIYTLTCEVCNNTYESLKDANVKVCPVCRTTLSGEGKCLLRCKSCGSPFNGIYSHTNYCPACNEEIRTFTCELCNNNYQYIGDNLDRYAKGVKVCSECAVTLPGEGRNILRCNDCNHPFKTNGSVTNYCPSCDEKRRTFKCEICNSNYKYSGDSIDSYKGNVKVCPICEESLPGEGIYLLRCKGCNSPFKANGNITNYCPSCDEKRRIFTCEICCNNYKYTKRSPGSVKIKVCPECEKDLPGTGNRIVRCRTCNSPFKSTTSATNYCPSCNEKIRTFTCEVCNYQYTEDKLCQKGIKVCPECEKILSGEGDYVVRCKTCNSPFKAASISANCCPACDDKRRAFTCELCGCSYQYSKRPDQCTIKVCPTCEATLPGEGDIIVRCKGCNTPFKSTSGYVK